MTYLLRMRCCKQHGCTVAEVRRDAAGDLYAETRTRYLLADIDQERWETTRGRQTLTGDARLLLSCGHPCIDGLALAASDVRDMVVIDTPKREHFLS